MAKKCSSKRKDGKPCGAYAITGSKYCATHDPSLAAERAAWRSAGGRNRAIPEGLPAELLTVEDVRKGLAAVIGSTWKQHNKGERSRALCNLYLAVLRTFELGDLADRVAALEARLNERIDG